MQSYRQSEFCGNSISRIRPRLGGLPHLETFTWQIVTPAERVTRSGRPGYPPWREHPTYHVNVIKWKWEIIWTGGLPHLSGLRGSRVLLSNQKSVFTLLAANYICCKTGLNVDGKTSNIAFQLVLKECCKTSYTFLLPVFLVSVNSL